MKEMQHEARDTGGIISSNADARPSSDIARAIPADELALINKYTRRALTANDVYTFDVTLCDNEIDRDLERFDSESIPLLAELFVGKTGIYDHCPSAKNQCARVYFTECITDEIRTTQAGEPYRSLSAKAYIPRTKANASLIEEIDSGIKKEVSIGCAMGRVTCSICGEELRTGTCSHKRGRSYKGKLCHAVLSEPKDAYEWSFVAVPAQPEAGVQTDVSKQKEGGRFAVNKKCGVYYDGKAEIAAQCKNGDVKLSDEQGELLQIRSSVREDVRRLAMAVMPSLDEETASAMCGRLSYKQCRDFADALREKRTLPKPKTPQLAVRKTENTESNAAFRI